MIDGGFGTGVCTRGDPQRLGLRLLLAAAVKYSVGCIWAVGMTSDSRRCRSLDSSR